MWIECGQRSTAQEYRFGRKPAMSSDPGADCRRIGRTDKARRGRGIVLPPFLIDQAGRMEAQNGSRSHTDTVARNFAQHESAGRIAGSIDYDPFAGALESLKEVEERHHIAARTCEDTHVGQCGRQADEKKSSGYYRAPHRNLPMVAGERGPRRRGSIQVYPHSMCEAMRVCPLGYSQAPFLENRRPRIRLPHLGRGGGRPGVFSGVKLV